ncbi:hypothetical protein OG21DRAFT_1528297 [Imleria badia]|nr:hypothetical protein OG21DRAFT_1528297 [Imleria badia]
MVTDSDFREYGQTVVGYGWMSRTCETMNRAELHNAQCIPYSTHRPPTGTASLFYFLAKGQGTSNLPWPIHSVLLYKDIHITELVMGPSAFETIQGTLFPEFMRQEYPKNMSILVEGINAKGEQTLFRHMGDYVYVYQRDALKYACDCIQGGHLLPTPSYWNLNATIRFEDRIMGPVHLYNFVEELYTIFKASQSKEEGRTPSYCQASDIIRNMKISK